MDERGSMLFPKPDRASRQEDPIHWLLVIAIDTYGFDPLVNPVRDAKAFIKILKEKYGFEDHAVITCFNDVATKGGIWDHLEILEAQVRSQDSVIIYYAGHGAYNEKRDWGYWVPYDGNPSRKDDTCIRDRSIVDLLKVIECQHIVLFSDSCFSGTFFDYETSRGVREAFSDKASRWAITSGRKKEVKDGPKGKGSPFSRYLIEALEGGPPTFLLSELANEVKVAVASDTELFQLPRAEPLLIRGHRGGEYVFRKEKESKEGQQVYSIEEDKQAFDRAQSVGTEAAYQKYIDGYPSGIFRKLAEFEIKQLLVNSPISKEENSKRRSSSTQKKSVSLAEEKREKELGIEMIKVAGGIFWMGNDSGYKNEKPAHQVQLNSFYIGKYPITQGQWKAIMGENPSHFKDCNQCPVEWVSWNDIQIFLKKLDERYPEKNYRLPTEAEWEYAARGGQLSKGYKYAGSNNFNEVGWYKENSDDKTHPVGQKHPNELGIYDMSGNVFEWCQDWYSGTYYHECHTEGIIHNPKGPEDGKHRVVRGGSWYDDNDLARVSFRSFYFNPSSRDYSLGFRLCRY